MEYKTKHYAECFTYKRINFSVNPVSDGQGKLISCVVRATIKGRKLSLELPVSYYYFCNNIAIKKRTLNETRASIYNFLSNEREKLNH